MYVWIQTLESMVLYLHILKTISSTVAAVAQWTEHPVAFPLRAHAWFQARSPVGGL